MRLRVERLLWVASLPSGATPSLRYCACVYIYCSIWGVRVCSALSISLNSVVPSFLWRNPLVTLAIQHERLDGERVPSQNPRLDARLALRAKAQMLPTIRRPKNSMIMKLGLVALPRVSPDLLSSTQRVLS